MILTLRRESSQEEREDLLKLLGQLTCNRLPVAATKIAGREVVCLESKQCDAQAQSILHQHRAIAAITPVSTPYQLMSRAFKAERSRIVIGEGHNCQPVTIGGEDGSPLIMAGPCAVESREQLIATARAVKAAGAHVLRGGAFKPRTSPYQFQGLGSVGLELLAQARQITGLPVITEVMEPDLVETVAEYADMLQIGSRNMQNFPLLLAAGRNSQQRPVLLKRGLASTIEEWLLAAEYLVAAGNPHVILCERGIRSFDPQTRNLLDLSCIPLLHELTHLPIIVDPSHATGRRELVPTMSRAGIAAGAEGLIIEVHPDPNSALCDGRQSITPDQLRSIIREAGLLAQLISGKAELTYVA
jgi:3-deoxy-7-phosphoheptulonate synthase